MGCNSYVAGALGAAVLSVQLVYCPESLGSQRPGVRARGAELSRGPGGRIGRPGPEPALVALTTLEPPPAGDQIVLWARPSKPQLPIKVRGVPSCTAASVGEARGTTAIQVLPAGLAKGRGGCREWLAAVPAGYVCRSEVTLEAGYASAPPAQETATRWQHYRYGVVTAKQVGLRSGAGKYLRATLQKGDGVTVVREVNGQTQLIDRQWLARKDLELMTPPAVTPLLLGTLPPGARPAWVVPAAGESLVPVYPLGGSASELTSVALLPRYSMVLYTDAPARPGRVLVLLTDESRAALKAYPEAQAARAVELPAGSLRRFIPVAPPPEVGPEERWIDISLREQVATAYLGKTPLFTTLISTGKDGKTPPGSFFIYRKYLTQTMANQRGAAAQYDFREVPHAQFFNGRIGLHAVLWHDSLGNPVSHGCVNLSPAAAREFFAFSEPPLPTGWHSVTAGAPAPAPGPAPKTALVEPPRGPGATLLASAGSGDRFHSPALVGTRVVVRR